MESQKANLVDANLAQDLEAIFAGIKAASLDIYKVLQLSLGEYTQSTNATGDTQLKADVEADKILQEKFATIPCVAQICSEEQDNAIP